MVYATIMHLCAVIFELNVPFILAPLKIHSLKNKMVANGKMVRKNVKYHISEVPILTFSSWSS